MALLKNRILEEIQINGPMPLSRYMQLCLLDPDDGYYTTKFPFGAQGDFVTAADICQIFGELIGIWLIQVWQMLGCPKPCRIVELGPGRGTLMQDIFRALRLQPTMLTGLKVEFVEAHGILRDIQNKTLKDAPCPVHWYADFQTKAIPTLVVANEFFDALPVSVFVKTKEGFAERHITTHDGLSLCFVDIPISSSFPEPFCSLPYGTVFEMSSARFDFAHKIATQIHQYSGAALIIDYGFEQPKWGTTFQAVKHHQTVDPLMEPGHADLTALVDFTALAQAFKTACNETWGPISQRNFLINMGIMERLQVLVKSLEDKSRQTLQQSVARLIDPDDMGHLFKVAAFTSFHDAPIAFHDFNRKHAMAQT